MVLVVEKSLAEKVEDLRTPQHSVSFTETFIERSEDERHFDRAKRVEKSKERHFERSVAQFRQKTAKVFKRARNIAKRNLI